MERQSRTPIIEPLLLMLKQRTGIATILAVAVGVYLLQAGYTIEQIAIIISPIMVYIGGQKYVDANETTTEILDVIESFDGSYEDQGQESKEI